MNSEPHEDMAWKALEETAKEVAPGLPLDLLKKAYAIQKRHQFSKDRSESVQLMDKLIEAHIGGVE
jgi:hypothetical protein